MLQKEKDKILKAQTIKYLNTCGAVKKKNEAKQILTLNRKMKSYNTN